MERNHRPSVSVYTRYRIIWVTICSLAVVNAGALFAFSSSAAKMRLPIIVVGSVVTVLLYVALKKSRTRFREVCKRGAAESAALCPFCAYDLEDTGEVVTCSECGSRVKTVNLSTYWIQVSRKPYWRSDRELLRRLVGV